MDNIEPTTEEEIKKVIEDTVALAGLSIAHAPEQAPAPEPDPEMDAYIAKFDTLAQMVETLKRAQDETAALHFLSTGDKKVMEVIKLQNELLGAIVEHLVAMNNVFAPPE